MEAGVKAQPPSLAQELGLNPLNRSQESEKICPILEMELENFTTGSNPWHVKQILQLVLLDTVKSVFCVCVWWGWGLNSELCTCKAGTLLLKPHLQSISLWLLWS
jgi:hypothetical protein